MAENQILVKFKPQGHQKLINAINKLSLSQTALEKGVKAYEKQLKRLNRQQGKYNKTTAGGVRNNRIMGGSIATLRSAMLLYSFAIGAVITKVISLTKEQAKLDNLAHGFDKLSEAGNFSVGTLENLRMATNNTMSDMDLLTQANNAMILGVGENTSQMAFMFDAAQRLGRVLGRDTKSSVESLVTGIGRQSRLMLDNIGIIVKAEEAYEAYAKANNITADSLSESERKAAFLQATIKGVTEAVSKLGDETDNLQDDIQTLGSFFDNLTASMVSYFGLTDNIKTVTEFYAKHAKQTSAVDDEQNELNKRFKEQQNEIIRTRVLMDAYAVTIRNAKFDNIRQLTKDIKENNRVINERGAKSLFEQDIDAWAELVNKNKDLKAELEKTKTTWVSSDERIRELSDSINKMESGLKTGIEKWKFIRREIIETNHQLMLTGGKSAPVASDAIRGISSAWDQYLQKVPAVNIENENLQASLLDQVLSYDNLNDKIIPYSQAFVSAYSDMISSVEDMISAGDNQKKKEELQAAESIKNTRVRQQTIDGINDKYDKLEKKGKKEMFGFQVAEALANTALGVTQVLATPMPTALKIPLSLMIAAAGAAQVETMRRNTFEDGGLVGGRRHSQGGTIIEAEQGEFVMRRSAVDAIGIENLNRMNQGGGAAINITFTGNVMSQDFIENEAIPQIKEAIRRGADIGVS